MAYNLFPLIFKPGIKRDGTKFQAEFCTDGEGVRFQDGRVQKVGGAIAAQFPGDINNSFASNLRIEPDANGNMVTFISNNQGVFVYTLNFNGFTISIPAIPTVTNTSGHVNPFWQSELVINATYNNNIVNAVTQNIVYMLTDAGNTMYNTGAPIIYYGTLDGADLTLLNNNTAGILPSSNGGMCYSNPYLFLYGEGGVVQYSTSRSPYQFTGADSGSQTISNDKIIYGAPIRGGSNTPTILFWTVSSVIRLINIGISGTDTVLFKPDVISKDSSIMSSRCVVEYDGTFYWIGTERFFVYNGLVNELRNPMSTDYFFDNVDMNHRQKVYGVKHPKFGEIRWYYPIKGSNGAITRVIVYNKRENTFYDDVADRDCAVYSNAFGILATFGKARATVSDDKFLWIEEQGVTEDNLNTNTQVAIPSYFTTPTFSWAAFNPARQLVGVDKFVYLKTLEPDFVQMTDAGTVKITGTMTLTVNSQRYAQEPISQIFTTDFTGTDLKIDIGLEGRHISLTFASQDDFEFGHNIIAIGEGAGQ